MQSTLMFTLYITAQSLVGDLASPDWDKVFTQLREARVDAVVLESYRGGLSLDEATLRTARDRFREAGFETLGGLMPVWGEGFGKRGEGIETRIPFFCYSDEGTVKALGEEIRKLSRVFEQVVVDDALLTSCRCDGCERDRAGRPWDEARRDLLGRIARRWTDAAHSENPKVVLTVKFPQYYDRLHLFGYDASSFPVIFDRVWIGTETRDPETPKFGYTQPYQGYFNARWMKACAGDKFECGWFDYLDCDDRLFYEQAVSTCLAAPSRVTLFCYGEGLLGSKAERLAQTAPLLADLREAAREPWGLTVLKPANGDGGHNLFIYDDLGMMGIPCVPDVRLQKTTRNAFVPTQAAADAGSADIPLVIEAGGQVILTHESLLRLVGDPAVQAAFGYRPANVSTNRIDARAFEVGEKRIEAATPFRVGGDLEPEPEVEVMASAVYGSWSGDNKVPLITVKTHPSGGRAVVWNIATFGHDAYTMEEHLCVPVRSELLRLPAEVIAAIRNSALAPLGITLEMPPRVSAFLFEKNAVFVNYTDAPAAVRADGLDWNPDALTSDSPDTAWGDGVLTVPAGGWALVPLS